MQDRAVSKKNWIAVAFSGAATIFLIEVYIWCFVGIIYFEGLPNFLWARLPVYHQHSQ